MIRAPMHLACPRNPGALLRRSGVAVLAVLAFGTAGAPARAHEPAEIAIRSLELRVADSPGRRDLRLQLAELRRVARDFAGAARELDRLESVDAAMPGLAPARARLALDQGDPDAAVRALDRAPVPGEEGERARLRALAAQDRGDALAAIEAWDVAVARLEPPTPDDYLARARLLVSLDREAEARRGLEEGVARLGPAFALTRALEALGGDEAESSFERAVPDDPPAGARNADPESPGGEAARANAGPGNTPAAITITRGPYLQSMTPTSVVVRWRTSEATDARVNIGRSPERYPKHFDQITVGTEHEVFVDSLLPATRYSYKVGSTTEDAAGGDSLFFRTHPEPGTDAATRLWILGDSGLPGTAQNQVRDAFVNYTGARGADLVLMLGDNAYSTGLDTEYQSGLFAPYRAQLQKWPLWSTRGNHDVVRSGANNDYYEFFTFPKAAEAGGVASGTEAYYSFDYGQVHFICLDSEGSTRTPGSAMLTWLAGDLAANDKWWTIVYFHHPPYTKGSHDSDNVSDSGGRMRDMREYALPILEAAGVDLVLNGHSHSYERSFLIDGHYGTSGTFVPSMKVQPGDGRVGGSGEYTKPTLGSGPHEGTVYAVDGSGGQISGGTLNHPAMVSSLNVLGSMVVDIGGGRMNARFLSNTGVVRDSFTIQKGTVTATPPLASGKETLRIGAATPNPFRDGVLIEYAVAERAHVRLEVFDPAGRRVARLADGMVEAGSHLARWDGRDADGTSLPAGIYLARVEAGGRQVSRRIVLIR